MSYKEDFKNAVENDGITSAWLSRNVASVPDLRSYSTAEEAVLAIADYFVNENEFLKLYAGVPVIDLQLRIGQRNQALLALLVSALEGDD